MKKVSVIVPIYRVPCYIEKCVQSLLSQTFKNLEIILVDDGSPDECPSICDDLARKDERIRVIHKLNGGLSSARNAGIEIATGDYLAFVDGDDFVSPDYIEALLDACVSSGSQMAACGYTEYYSEKRQNVHCGAESCLFSPEEAVRDIFTMKNIIHVVAWNKLYARELFTETNIRYPEGKIHEDVFTTYKYCAIANQVAYVNRPCYYYVQREGSIISQNFSPKRLQLLDAVDSIAAFVEKNKPCYDEEYQIYRFLNYLTIINAMADSNYCDRKLFLKMRTGIKKMLPQLKKNSYFSKKNRLTCMLLNVGMKGYYVVRKKYKKFGQ